MLWQICQAEYFPRNLRLRSSVTKLRYKQAIDVLGKYLGRDATLEDLNDDTFVAWLIWLVERRGVCERTANGIVGRLRTLWTFLAKRKVVDCFPTAQNLPVPEYEPLAWSQEELQRLFVAATQMPGMVGHVRAGVWWPALLAWFWATSERLGATLSMEAEHLDLDRGIACLPAKIRKGGRKPATYHLPRESADLIRRIYRPKGKVFFWDKSLESYFLHWDRLLRLAGLPGGRKRKSQAIRVSHATWLTVAGGDATKKLQHGSAETTRKHYIDLRHFPDTGVELFKPWSELPPDK
jgi:integrase